MTEQTPNDWRAAARRKVLKLEADSAGLSARYRMLTDRRADLLTVREDRKRHLASLKDSRIRPQSDADVQAHLQHIAQVEAQLADFDALLGDIAAEIEHTQAASQTTISLRDSTKKAALAAGAMPALAYQGIRL